MNEKMQKYVFVVDGNAAFHLTSYVKKRVLLKLFPALAAVL